MSEKQRVVQVPVSRAAAGNTDNYHLQLENERLLITETDGRRGIGISMGGVGLDVRKDETGRLTGYSIRAGDITYSDLDGDGRIDGYVGPGYTGHILIGCCFVPVRVGKGGLHMLAVQSEDGTHHYQFIEGHWQRFEDGLHHYIYQDGRWQKGEL